MAALCMLFAHIYRIVSYLHDYNNVIIVYRREADDYKKERNVLAHQSTLLMQGLNCDDGLDKLRLLQELEDLKRMLEDERNQYSLELNSLQVYLL